jgi:hypothetical protein
MIALTSRDWGLYTNQISALVEDGSLGADYKRVTVAFQSEPAEVFDNIRRESFTIQNTDGASDLTITITSAAQTLVTTTTNALNIDLNDYDTVGELVAFINGQVGYSCTVTPGQENASPLELDGVSGQDINSAPYVATSNMQAVIDTLNANSNRVSAEAANGANNRTAPQNNPGGTVLFLSGAVEGAYDSTAWSNALTALEAENVQFVSTPDSDAAVHAAIKTHCESMSSVTGRRERQFLVGAPYKTGAASAEIAAAISAAQTLNPATACTSFNGGTAAGRGWRESRIWRILLPPAC